MADDDDKKKDGNDEDVTSLKRALANERSRANAAEKSLNELKKDAEKRDAESKSLTEKVELLLKENAETKLESLRTQVATEKGLSLKQARRLSGSTREELERDADDLIAEFGIKSTSGKDKDDDGQDGEDGTGRDDREEKDQRDSGKNRRDAGRPKEKLVSGAANPDADDESTKIGDLANQVLASGFH